MPAQLALPGIASSITPTAAGERAPNQQEKETPCLIWESKGRTDPAPGWKPGTGAPEREAWPPGHRGDAPHHGRGHAGWKLLLGDSRHTCHLFPPPHLHVIDFIPVSCRGERQPSAQGPHQEEMEQRNCNARSSALQKWLRTDTGNVTAPRCLTVHTEFVKKRNNKVARVLKA